jgi:hypothetical protein
VPYWIVGKAPEKKEVLGTLKAIYHPCRSLQNLSLGIKLFF